MVDRLHWSFADGPILASKVFPEGFSAVDSTLPAQEFSPQHDWENTYDVVYTGPPSFTQDSQVYYGSLTLTAKYEKNRVHLQAKGIRQLNQDFATEYQYLQAESICNCDKLHSLRSDSKWSVRTQLKNQLNPATKSYGQLEETGRLIPGKIEKMDAAGKMYVYRTVAPDVPIVSDWALLAAVAGLDRGPQHQFSYFKHLESFSLGHTVTFLETFSARFGKREINLHGYVHTGPSIAPSFYWVDDFGRLLIARFSLSMLVYNPRPLLERISRNEK